MKTLTGWNKSGEDFSHYANPGDQIDEGIWDYMLGTVPPIHIKGKGFFMGEPMDFNKKGEYIYLHFIGIDGKLYYTGIHSMEEMDSYSPADLRKMCLLD